MAKDKERSTINPQIAAREAFQNETGVTGERTVVIGGPKGEKADRPRLPTRSDGYESQFVTGHAWPNYTFTKR